MKVQKIANYDQRMYRYRAERREFWLKTIPLVAAIGAFFVFGGVYGLVRLGMTPDLDWRVSALLLWVGMLVLPVKMLHPEEPFQSDIQQDQALRRAAGMDDSVDE